MALRIASSRALPTWIHASQADAPRRAGAPLFRDKRGGFADVEHALALDEDEELPRAVFASERLPSSPRDRRARSSETGESVVDRVRTNRNVEASTLGEGGVCGRSRSLGQVGLRGSPLVEEFLVDSFSAREGSDREQQGRRALRPGGIGHLDC